MLVLASGCADRQGGEEPRDTLLPGVATTTFQARETATTAAPASSTTLKSGFGAITNVSPAGFSGYYSYAKPDYTPKVPGYTLPLASSGIVNYEAVKAKVKLQDDTRLLGGGFTVVRNPYDPGEDDITALYKRLKDDEVPVFVTTDSLLHLYHIQFDESLRQIEERQFYDLAWNISKRLADANIRGYESAEGDEKEAYRRNIAYFTVALNLLEPKTTQYCVDGDWECLSAGDKFDKAEYERYALRGFPCCSSDNRQVKCEVCEYPVQGDVYNEVSLIDAHQGFEKSPIFRYKEDYSQYTPRGHYTRSEKLRNYFRAMMWYGRMSFLLKKSDIVSEGDARIQTVQASLIAAQIAGDPQVKTMWDRIYGVTGFYVGFSDDLGPYEYREAADKVFGDGRRDMSGDGYARLKAELAAYRSPKIYGGTGDCVIMPPFRPEDADRCLEDTKGFRLMGQRFIPDSYMFQNLVFPYTGDYTGSGAAFTYCGPGRCFPRGLDVMSLLGSRRAAGILRETGDASYVNYTSAYLRLDGEFGNFTEAEWNRNLYWSWLYALKPLLAEYGSGYPTFMQSNAWQEKELTTALASWTELRHDTILYAKQSYTMKAGSAFRPEPEKPVVGYVEPVPEFYGRLLALTKMTSKGLGEMDVLDDESKARLMRLEDILSRLEGMSVKELENRELSQDDYEFIKDFGDSVNGVISDVDEKAKKTTIVADVHTDSNTESVLEEGVGYVDMMLVAYKVPDGRVILGAGPVFSYYEFKQPMADRLTDENWREMLASNPPNKPEWQTSPATKPADALGGEGEMCGTKRGIGCKPGLRCQLEEGYSTDKSGICVKAECLLNGDCAAGGCSGQICTTKDKATGIVTTCEYRSEYECYAKATCGCSNGRCGWLPTAEFQSCLAGKGVYIREPGAV